MRVEPSSQVTRDFVSRTFACSGEIADLILLRGKTRAFAAHAIIARQGERLAQAYLLILGRAHALLYSADGQVILLHEFRPGDIFGALCEAEPVPEEADIVALEEVEALMMEGRSLVLLAEQHGCIGLALSRLLLRRLRQTTVRMYERAALSAVGRVYAELLRQARQSADLTIRPAPVLAEVALRVASTRETVSRAVNALERRGIIRRDPESLVLVAPHRLEEMIL